MPVVCMHMCMGAHSTWAHLCFLVHMNICAHVCEGQRLTRNVFLDQAPLFLNQELTDLASLVSSVPWEPLCSPPGYWGYKGAVMYDYLAFTWALGL